MQEPIKPCPYCGSEAKLPNLQEWPYTYSRNVHKLSG
ncbi:Lar family restriction alleviation protein [Porticoccaceae bacterium]|nr:Lar family restriction alleviation protein [Porticoccaceae bacterium]MDA9090922.1 Lar family restriction alleviation protein [Porticoccaceae bacterium]